MNILWLPALLLTCMGMALIWDIWIRRSPASGEIKGKAWLMLAGGVAMIGELLGYWRFG